MSDWITYAALGFVLWKAIKWKIEQENQQTWDLTLPVIRIDWPFSVDPSASNWAPTVSYNVFRREVYIKFDWSFFTYTHTYQADESSTEAAFNLLVAAFKSGILETRVYLDQDTKKLVIDIPTIKIPISSGQ